MAESGIVKKPTADEPAGEGESGAITATVMPPTPPGVSEIQLTAAFMQKPDMFASLSDVRKQQVFENMDKADQRQAEHAGLVLQSNEKVRLRAMEDRAETRAKLLRLCYAVGASGLLMFGVLVFTGHVDQAIAIAKGIGQGLALLLGGAGIAGAARKYFS